MAVRLAPPAAPAVPSRARVVRGRVAQVLTAHVEGGQPAASSCSRSPCSSWSGPRAATSCAAPSVSFGLGPAHAPRRRRRLLGGALLLVVLSRALRAPAARGAARSRRVHGLLHVALAGISAALLAALDLAAVAGLAPLSPALVALFAGRPLHRRARVDAAIAVALDVPSPVDPSDIKRPRRGRDPTRRRPTARRCRADRSSRRPPPARRWPSAAAARSTGASSAGTTTRSKRCLSASPACRARSTASPSCSSPTSTSASSSAIARSAPPRSWCCRARPDLIVLTGDLLDHDVRSRRQRSGDGRAPRAALPRRA